MSSTALKVFAAIAVLVALVLAAVGYRVSHQYAQRAERAQQQVQQQQAQQEVAVVALKPLAAYAPIPRDGVALVPVSVVPKDRYTSVEDVINKVPLVDIDAGAPVTQRYFRGGSVMSRIIPADHQAVSVEVDDVVAVGGFLRPGDIVDVLLYLRNNSGKDKAQSRVLLKDVRVLAYQERIIDRPEGLSDDDKQQAQQRSRKKTAVLSIPKKDTTRLMLGASVGDIRLALHGQGPADEGAETQVAAATAQTKKDGVPDQALTLDELARIKPPPGKKVAPAPRVEVLHGSSQEYVTTH